MPNFLIIYTKGQARLGGGSISFEKQPGLHQIEVAAAGKLSAFAKAAEHFQKMGLKVSVETDGDGNNNLGFSDQHIAQLAEGGTLLSTTPATGVRIEKIVPAF